MNLNQAKCNFPEFHRSNKGESGTLRKSAFLKQNQFSITTFFEFIAKNFCFLFVEMKITRLVVCKSCCLLFLFSLTQCLLPWTHPRGAVPAGVWCRHESGSMRRNERRDGQKGGTDTTHVGLWTRYTTSYILRVTRYTTSYIPWVTKYTTSYIPGVTSHRPVHVHV